MSKGRILI